MGHVLKVWTAVLRRTFGPKGQEVIECSRKLHDDEEEKPSQSVQP